MTRLLSKQLEEDHIDALTSVVGVVCAGFRH